MIHKGKKKKKKTLECRTDFQIPLCPELYVALASSEMWVMQHYPVFRRGHGIVILPLVVLLWVVNTIFRVLCYSGHCYY